MASDFEHRIVYRTDERGVILDSAIVGPGDDTPEGFQDKAEYQALVFTEKEAPPLAESKITTWDGLVLGQTVDVIKGDSQEGPSEPGGVAKDDVDFDEPDTVESGDELVVDSGDDSDSGQTVDEVKGDDQEGPSDPGGEQSAKADEKPVSRRSGKSS
jgi:hypothetical protein